MVGDAPPTALKSFTCQACGKAISIRAAGMTVTAVCPACGAVSDEHDGDFRLVQKSQQTMAYHPKIPLGTKGRLRGQVYQVIGFVHRFDPGYLDDPWEEYLLYNPFVGYAWLCENNGHWTLYKMTKSKPTGYLSVYKFLGDSYRMYHRGHAKIAFVIGEFYWRVRVGDEVTTIDAICPPHILSMEQSGDDLIWSIGEYIEPRDVTAAFHPNPMPRRHGVAPNQPSLVQSAWEMWFILFIAFVAITIVQVVGGNLRTASSSGTRSIAVEASGLAETEIASFETTRSSTPVLINVWSSLNQTWATVGLRIVSEDTAKPYAHEFEKELSYYSGYSDGESWAEGARSAEFLLNSLPRGHYHVFLTSKPEPNHAIDLSTRVTVSPNIWSNYWLVLFLILLPPGILALRARSFERGRWSESELDPMDKPERL